jgi:hypothetical protein
LRGDTQEEQVEHAKQIMDEVANELYYLTGFGIDKGVIKVGSTKVVETVYPELVPSLNHVKFVDALLIGFSPAYCYHWCRGNNKKMARQASEVGDGWVIKPNIIKRKASFRLPVISRYCKNPSGGYTNFFVYQRKLIRKGKRNSYGFAVTYNKADPPFTRFIARFYEEGNLSFGSYRVFGSRNYDITGRFWPLSKAKPDKHPRKSRLASQPTDDTEYVYFIRAGRTNIYKIGKSNDPKTRLASLQTANPYKLKLLHTFKADNASAAEEELHHLLQTKRMEGEWFRITPKQRDIILSIEHFKEGQFWIDSQEVDVNKLFD